MIGAKKMGLKDWFNRPTLLQLALTRGMQPVGDIADELRTLSDYSIKSRADAEAICKALDQLMHDQAGIGGDSALHAIVGLFQDVDGRDCPAFSMLSKQGIAKLASILDGALAQNTRWKDNDVLFALKVLAMYGTRPGTQAVIRAAQAPFRSDNYWWQVILRAYSMDHPHRDLLFQALREPLPKDFIAVSLLDAANAALIEGAQCAHPFDSTEGKQRLEAYLRDSDPDHFSYAVSATAALPHISNPERDSLLALALDHPDVQIQLEGAWAAAKLGREAGIKCLQRYCLEVNHSETAKRYLTELAREDAIPTEAKEPDFQAQAEFAQWLRHPNELGRSPDELQIVDRRELAWPPERGRKQFWLIQYRVRDSTGLAADDVGVGLVGSVTFCLFSYRLEERPPEDAYAIHCFWEMQQQGLISVSDVDEGSTEYDQSLRQWTAGDLDEAHVVCVGEMSPALQYPQPIVALARARRNNKAGWVILDGPRSRWYAESEMPAEQFDKLVLEIHVGRELLGFHDQPDRRSFMKMPTPRRAPQQIITAYEKLLNEARRDQRQTEKLLGESSVLGSCFSDYASALAEFGSLTLPAATARAYESLLAVANAADHSLHAKLFDSFAPLGRNFDAYVEALIGLNRQAEVSSLVELFRPYWDHNLGYGQLGLAAFKSGNDQLAETLFVKLRHSLKDWCRSEEMGCLAEIWCRKGQKEAAHSLLVEALRGVLAQSRSASGTDRKRFEEWFQNHRATYLRLFPDRGEAGLFAYAIPSSTRGE
jgi:hypothetical protein